VSIEDALHMHSSTELGQQQPHHQQQQEGLQRSGYGCKGVLL
jgi:hypothetical protein